jgi:N-acetyl-gamma-glutamyl-phosphate reductase
MPRDYPVSAHSITGYSGGGRAMIERYGEPHEAANSPAPQLYALRQTHKHLPEMTKMSGLDFEPLFTPHVADYYSGIFLVLPLYKRLLSPEIAGTESVRRIFEERYELEPLIKVMPAGEEPEDGFLAANAMAGKSGAEVWVTGNDERILLATRYDNLGKGASGAAVQCMNIMFELSEERGLP